jgi:hypothetical protein
MNTETAAKEINQTLLKLEQAIGEPVFDEWALVSNVPTGWNIHQYGGTRRDVFLSAFKEDVAALQDTLDLDNPLVGDFAFSHDGHGTGFDAHMCVGHRTYVLFNNTEKNTGEITENPKWKSAQIHFATLLDAFIVDPVRI